MSEAMDDAERGIFEPHNRPAPTLEQRIAYLEEQLVLATQELVRHQLTINHLSRGQTIVQKSKPGFEEVVIEVPLPRGAPLYKLVLAAEEMQQPSALVDPTGRNFVKPPSANGNGKN